MAYRYMADVVMIVHFAFIVFVAVGAILAWRWRKLIWAHLFAVAWGVGIVLVGYECPLTPLERYLRRRGGEEGYDEGWGFVDAYIEGVIYPEKYTAHFRVLAAALIAVGWIGWYVKHRRVARHEQRPVHLHHAEGEPLPPS
jgi:hypothetical protein